MQLPLQQLFNQSLIKLAVLLYQIDRKVMLTEQDYLDEVLEEMDWQSPISQDAFFNEAIYQARQAIDTGDEMHFVRELQQDLLFDPDRALEVAMAITGVDGERSEEETEVLSLLTHKLLAKGLAGLDASAPQGLSA